MRDPAEEIESLPDTHSCSMLNKGIGCNSRTCAEKASKEVSIGLVAVIAERSFVCGKQIAKAGHWNPCDGEERRPEDGVGGFQRETT